MNRSFITEFAKAAKRSRYFPDFLKAFCLNKKQHMRRMKLLSLSNFLLTFLRLLKNTQNFVTFIEIIKEIFWTRKMDRFMVWKISKKYLTYYSWEKYRGNFDLRVTLQILNLILLQTLSQLVGKTLIFTVSTLSARGLVYFWWRHYHSLVTWTNNNYKKKTEKKRNAFILCWIKIYTYLEMTKKLKYKSDIK